MGAEGVLDCDDELLVKNHRRISQGAKLRRSQAAVERQLGNPHYGPRPL